MKRFILCLSMLLIGVMHLCAQSEVMINMEKENGVYKIPCLVNGAKMKFIFDTGASSVSISSSMANYLLENDYISADDIKGQGKFGTADGRIVDHTKIVLKDIEIAGLHLYNVEATVMQNASAPMLLGQTAIQKLGRIELQGNKLIIKDASVSDEDKDAQIQKWIDKAKEYIEMHLYSKAKEMLQKVYAVDGLSAYGIYQYAQTCYFGRDLETAYEVLNNIEDYSYYDENKVDIYSTMADVCWGLKKYDEALAYYERSFDKAFGTDEDRAWTAAAMAAIHSIQGNHNGAAIEYKIALYCMEMHLQLEEGYLWKDCNGYLKKSQKSYRTDTIDSWAFYIADESYEAGSWSLDGFLAQIKKMASIGNKEARKRLNKAGITY